MSVARDIVNRHNISRVIVDSNNTPIGMITELHSPVILPSLRKQIQMTITEDAPPTSYAIYSVNNVHIIAKL